MCTRRLLGLLVAGLGTLGWAGAAYAVPISDSIELTDNFENILTDIHGHPAEATIQETDESSGSGAVTIVVPTTASAAKIFTEVALTIGDPSMTAPSPLSDTVLASIMQSGTSFVFEATLTSLSEAATVDCNSQSPTFSGAACFPETGGLEDVNGLLGIPSSLGIQVLVQSTTQVPEPGTLLLLTLGLGNARGQRRISPAEVVQLECSNRADTARQGGLARGGASAGGRGRQSSLPRVISSNLRVGFRTVEIAF